MLHGKYLTVIPYKCEVSSLAGALGKLKHSQDPGRHLYLLTQAFLLAPNFMCRLTHPPCAESTLHVTMVP